MLRSVTTEKATNLNKIFNSNEIKEIYYDKALRNAASIQRGGQMLKSLAGPNLTEPCFLSGITGADANGRIPKSPGVQFVNIFEKIGIVLGEAR